MKHLSKIGFLSLFTSSTTLLCCALPVTLSILASSATVVSLTSTFPFLITLSYYKNILFISAGVLILICLALLFTTQRECPIEAKEYCRGATRLARVLIWCSVIMYAIGLLFAYILPALLY